MDARVICNLNIRSNPSVNAKIHGYLKPGEEVKCIETVKGDAYEGNNVWVKLNTGEYIWSGGLGSPDALSVATVETPWWLKNFGILDVPEDQRGKGIRIALLDTGTPQRYYEDTKNIQVIDECNFVSDASKIMDCVGHATNCAGIIAGKGPTIQGVAPAVSFLIGKVTDSLYSLDEAVLIKAIDWAIQRGANIISMSLCVAGGRPSDHHDLHRKIKDAQKKNILTVAAIGNDGEEYMNYPAIFDECISVGAINRIMQITPETTRNVKLNLLAPGADIPAIVPADGNPMLSGTSFATAYVSAVMALLLSISNNPKIADILLRSSTEYAGFNPPYPPNTNKKFGIINPRGTIAKIKGVA
jgi:subtilisin family serine protease